MKIVKLYRYGELSEEAKDSAIYRWRSLQEELTNPIKEHVVKLAKALDFGIHDLSITVRPQYITVELKGGVEPKAGWCFDVFELSLQCLSTPGKSNVQQLSIECASCSPEIIASPREAKSAEVAEAVITSIREAFFKGVRPGSPYSFTSGPPAAYIEAILKTLGPIFTEDGKKVVKGV